MHGRAPRTRRRGPARGPPTATRSRQRRPGRSSAVRHRYARSRSTTTLTAATLPHTAYRRRSPPAFGRSRQYLPGWARRRTTADPSGGRPSLPRAMICRRQLRASCTARRTRPPAHSASVPSPRGRSTRRAVDGSEYRFGHPREFERDGPRTPAPQLTRPQHTAAHRWVSAWWPSLRHASRRTRSAACISQPFGGPF